MSYTFRVIFEGVCAYVPDSPFFARNDQGKTEAGHPKALHVLVPNLTPIGRIGTSLPIPNHYPTLRTRLRDLQSETDRNYQLLFRQPGGRDEMALFNLQGEEIDFKFEACSNEMAFTFGNWVAPNGQDRPNLSETREVQSLHWLPRLEEIAPDFDRILPHLIDPTPGRFPAALSARFAIGGGFFRVAGFNREPRTSTPQTWRFADPSNSNGTGVWNRAVGNRLALEYFKVKGPTRISLTAPRFGGTGTRIVLAPPPGTTEDVELTVSNVEPEMLFAPETAVSDFDPDFDVFYSLCKPPVAKSSQQTGRPIPNPPQSLFLGAFEKTCSGGGINRGT